jgi:hypothetical protein
LIFLNYLKVELLLFDGFLSWLGLLLLPYVAYSLRCFFPTLLCCKLGSEGSPPWLLPSVARSAASSFGALRVSCSPCSVVAPLRRQERSNPTDWCPAVRRKKPTSKGSLHQQGSLGLVPCCPKEEANQQGELTPARVAGTGALLSEGRSQPARGAYSPPCWLASLHFVQPSEGRSEATLRSKESLHQQGLLV